METLTSLLDDRFRLPGTNLRFGLDGLIGLIPGAGDLIGAGLSLAIVVGAWKEGAPLHLLARMGWNILLEFLVGLIPVLGDAFDFAFKANRRNLRLLRRWLERS